MIYLTVTEDEHGSGMQQLPIEEILYLQSRPNGIIMVHAESGVYYTAGSLTFWEPAFRGLSFFRADRGILINLDKIKAVDATYKLAYFEYPFTDTSKSCTMSYAGYKAISKRLAMGVPKITHAY